MKNLKFLFLSFFALSILAQDFDSKFLESLPEDIADDVLQRSKNSPGQEEPTYRPSKFSSKLEKEEELIKLKNRLEKDLEELERRLNADDSTLKISDDLKLFGSNFFQTIQTTFMPINEPNLGLNYILDFGDSLDIQLIGQKDKTDSYKIKRDGSINMPYIGKIVLSGLSLDEATSLIKSKVADVYIATDVFVTLSSIRDVNILVSGNALNPGIYTLNGNSNILHALSVAGGVNEFGSFREINLIRNNEIIETLDVYDLLIDGNYQLSKQLRSGDVIYVESAKNIVAIDGAVKRPAKYELNEDQNLDSIINYANGLTYKADLNNIYLERILDRQSKSLPIVNIAQFNKIKANDGDLIYIREIPYRTASIEGAVLKPGSYTMMPSETIYDLIDKAGGLTNNAYPFGAVLETKDALKVNELANEVLYEEFLDNIIAMSSINIEAKVDFAPIVKLTNEIKKTEPNGRVVVDLNAEKSESLVIQDGDKLIIPEIMNHIYVYGEVSSEGAVMYEEGVFDIDHYIKKSGGYNKFADNSAIYIHHPNGETQRYSKTRNIFASEPHNVKIYPGSIIFVPRKLDTSGARRLAAQAYVSILGNIGVALASLSAIDNN